MSLFDDIVSLPGKIVDGVVELSATAIAVALTLPLHVVEAAIKAGAKTNEEIQEFARKYME